MNKLTLQEHHPVVIIGAGPAGLTAAYELAKKNILPLVLEKNDNVGGLARTETYKGFRFDIGGHRFFTKVPLINDLWHEILNEDFLVRSRLSSIQYDGHYFNYPLKMFNALNGLGPVESSLVGLSYMKARLFPHKEETNFEQWVSNRFGSRLYEIFFKTYTEKVWGIPCIEISAEWAAQRIKNLSLREAVQNALLGNGRAKDGQQITTLIEQFYYPRLGPGMMWERCEELLLNHGAKTIRGVEVNIIKHDHGRVECVHGKTEAGEEVEFRGSQFISTMPLRELIHALDPRPPEDVLQAASQLRYRDFLTVVLILKRDSVFPENWIYIHSPEVKMGRVQNYKNWSPDMVPDPSYTSLGLEYFLWEEDEEWSWPKERLIELGIQECRQIGLIDPREVEDGTVLRVKKAYPVYDRQYHESLRTIRRYLDHFSNLQTIGRNGLHRYNNQDHSMMTGIYAARNIMTGGKNDVWSVNTETEYHEEGQMADVGTSDRNVSTTVTAAAKSPDEVIAAAFAKLDPLALGAAVGAVTSLGLFLATITLLLKGGSRVGVTLSLVGQYLLGFEVTWSGAFTGLIEGGLVGFLLGYFLARLRNWGMAAYASLLRRRVEAETRHDLLNKL
jgi:protoporphyrinogen oxidase